MALLLHCFFWILDLKACWGSNLDYFLKLFIESPHNRQFKLWRYPSFQVSRSKDQKSCYNNSCYCSDCLLNSTKNADIPIWAKLSTNCSHSFMFLYMSVYPCFRFSCKRRMYKYYFPRGNLNLDVSLSSDNLCKVYRVVGLWNLDLTEEACFGLPPSVTVTKNWKKALDAVLICSTGLFQDIRYYRRVRLNWQAWFTYFAQFTCEGQGVCSLS